MASPPVGRLRWSDLTERESEIWQEGVKEGTRFAEVARRADADPSTSDDPFFDGYSEEPFFEEDRLRCGHEAMMSYASPWDLTITCPDCLEKFATPYGEEMVAFVLDVVDQPFRAVVEAVNEHADALDDHEAALDDFEEVAAQVSELLVGLSGEVDAITTRLRQVH